MPAIKTPLRYPGGKSRAIKTLDSHFPTYKEMREPFVGGGSVFLHLMQKNPTAKYWINDKYYNLYCFWKTLRDEPQKLVTALLSLKATGNDQALWAGMRKDVHTMNSDFDRAVAFFILNKTSYSGLTEIGTYSPQAAVRNFTTMNINKLTRVAALIKNVEITNEDYSVLMDAEGEDVFIFLDPPYDILNENKSNALYGPDGSIHKTFDHNEFYTECADSPHKWMITYNHAEHLEKRFANYRQIVWQLQYQMQYETDTAGVKKAKTKNELLILNY